MELERKTCTFSYVDVCPSELFHNTGATHLAFVLTNFIHIEKPALNQVRQFKDTRGLDRRSKVVDYFINQIESNQILLMSIGYLSHRNVAFDNGKNFLIHHKMITADADNNARLQVNGFDTSVGQLISLA